MSLYEELPVYKTAQDMAVYFEKIVRHFDRYNKYTFGVEIRTLAHRILILVAKANTKQTRKEYLMEALDKLEELKIILRLAKEVKAFNSFKSFEFATKSVIEVSKQCEGWFKSQNS
jgi:F0F1-type ATP synthase assembly protein I